MIKVINEELNVKHNETSPADKSDFEQHKNSVLSPSTIMNINKDTSSVIDIVTDTNLVVLYNKDIKRIRLLDHLVTVIENIIEKI